MQHNTRREKGYKTINNRSHLLCDNQLFYCTFSSQFGKTYFATNHSYLWTFVKYQPKTSTSWCL